MLATQTHIIPQNFAWIRLIVAEEPCNATFYKRRTTTNWAYTETKINATEKKQAKNG